MSRLAARTREKNFLKFRLGGAIASCTAILGSKDISTEVWKCIDNALTEMEEAIKLWEPKVRRKK